MAEISFETLGSCPVPGATPGGDDARYEPEYAAVLEEIEKLSFSGQGAAVSWDAVRWRMLKAACMVFFCVFCLTSCIDQIVSPAYQREYMPELVNATDGKIDVILVFKNVTDGVKRLYHIRLAQNDSLPVWLDNYRGLAYPMGAYFNIVEQVLVVASGACTDSLARYRKENDRKYDTALPQEQLSEFLASCPSLIRITDAELEKIREAVAFYPNNATCLMVNADGTLTPLPESELPWYGSPREEPPIMGGLESLCADPTAQEMESLF